jgi:hypothetical protein
MPERLLQSPIVFWKIDRKIPPFPAPWITWIPMFFTQGMVIRYTGRPNKINMLRHSHIQFVGCTSYIYIYIPFKSYYIPTSSGFVASCSLICPSYSIKPIFSHYYPLIHTIIEHCLLLPVASITITSITSIVYIIHIDSTHHIHYRILVRLYVHIHYIHRWNMNL